MVVVVGRVNLLYCPGRNVLILKLIFFKECTICSDSTIHYIDETLQGMWYDHLKQCRKKEGYQLLSTKNPVSIPKRLNDKILALQQTFLNEDNNNNQMKRTWVTVEDINSFYIMDSEIKGQATSNEFGELIGGRFSGCLKCHQCYVGLWSCNIQLKNEDDICLLNKIVRDVDFSILPTSNDTKESLIKRISNSKYLDDIVIYYPTYSVLNETIQSHQPKRRSEGVVMGSTYRYDGNDGDGEGKFVIKLPNYTSYVRHPDNWHGRPMKNSTFLAGLICWRAGWPYLTEISRRCPPTHCQILFYYGVFKSHIGQHRDNSNTQYIKDILSGKVQKKKGHPSGGGENSQILGSNVLVLTVGSKPMLFKFKYPRPTNLTGKRGTYETNPNHQFTCGNMTISVLDPIDDLMMTHGVTFLYKKADDVNSWYRIGYCFRWLSSFKDFYVDSCTMRLDAKLVSKKRSNRTMNRNIFT